MSRIFEALLAVVYICAFSCSAIAQAVDGPELQKYSENVPTNITNSGGFSYQIPLRVPSYRALEPNLALQYNSTRKSRSSPGDVAGIGWKLSGFSEIERVSQKLGTPTFRDEDDIFLLDGQLLMACGDDNAQLTWDDPYPNRFQTDRQSASCVSGGNFSTMRESDRKIWRQLSDDTWTVYSKDGTQYIYKSLKALSGLTPSTDSGDDKVLRSKWLLTEKRDAQPTANVVRYEYSFDASSGYSYRPSAIRYADYSIIFGYEALEKPLAQWATGAGIIGEQKYRLISVHSYRANDTVKVAATRLEYSSSVEVGASLLTRVEHFGRDFAMVGEALTGGTVLPGPHIMTYASDQLSFEKQDYNGRPFSAEAMVIDHDGNGVDDLLFHAIVHNGVSNCYNGPNADGFSVQAPVDPAGFYHFFTDKSATPFTMAQTIRSLFVLRSVQPNRDYSRLAGVLRIDPNSTDHFFLRYRLDYTNNRNRDGDNWTSRPYFALIDSDGTVQSEILPTFYRVGNFDTNPKTQLLNFNISPTSLTRTGSSVFGSYFLDMDGDSLTEIIRYSPDSQGTTLTILDPKFNETPSFNQRLVSNTADGIKGSSSLSSLRRTFYATGDVNGDGKDDLIMYTIARDVQDKIFVSLSAGNRFLPRQLWSGSLGLPNSNPSVAVTKVMTVRDVTGDGLADIILQNSSARIRTQNCNGTLTHGFYRAPADVLVSDGAGLHKPKEATARRINNYVASGDFNGDGATDFATTGQNGSVHYGSGSQANLLTSVKGPQGGTTHIAYKSSVMAGTGNRAPGVRQVVTELRETNGRGAERLYKYSYHQDEYDFRLRQPLGFQTVTTTLPRIGWETEDPQIVTSYLNDHYGESGLVKSRTLTRDGQTWRKEIYDYAHQFDPDSDDFNPATMERGPYVVRKSSQRVATRYGTKLNETQMTYTWSAQGQPRRVTDLGRSVDGVDVTPNDNVTTVKKYAKNLDKYIVNTPRFEFIQSTTSGSIDTTTALWGRHFKYDGNASGTDEPTAGNLTEVQAWNGGASNNSKLVSLSHYDDRGNVLWERDAYNNQTTYSYSGPEDLFLTRTTNAIGQRCKLWLVHSFRKLQRPG